MYIFINNKLKKDSNHSMDVHIVIRVFLNRTWVGLLVTRYLLHLYEQILSVLLLKIVCSQV